MRKLIVFFDIDGTLLNENKIIPASTKKAVHLLQEKGIHTVIATGRVPSMFYWIQKELNIDSYVAMNRQYVVFEQVRKFTQIQLTLKYCNLYPL
jgi:HAD superfamily hydrolase (TIGR01484 family)